MFGNTNLFGTQTNPNNPPQPQQTGGGLFGSNMFGNTNQMPQQQQQPQQFQQQQPQQQAGLWGANATQSTNLSKGLFSQPTNTPSSGALGGMFGAPPSGSTGINKNNILGMFGSNTAGTGMQAPGFSSSVFPQTSAPAFMSGGGNNQPPGGMFGATGNLGAGSGIFGGGQTNQPTGIPQNQGGSNIFNQQQPQNSMQPIQNLGTGLQPGMSFGLQQQNPPTGTGLFGGTTSTNVPTNVFGGVATTTSSGLFGQSAMGSTSTMQQPSNPMGMMGKGGLFGNTMGQAQPQGFQTGNLGLGGVSTGMPQTQTKGTHVYKYQPVRTQETSVANGQQKIDHTFMNAITSMPEYGNRSIEELRYEDYTNKKLGIVPQTINQPMGNALQSNQPSSMGMFIQPAQKTNPFQANTIQTQPIQQTSTGGSLFSTAIGNKPSFMQNQPLTQQAQPQPGGMFFQQPATNTMGFAQPQQQNTSLLGGATGLGTSLFGAKSVMSPLKTGYQNEPAFKGMGGITSNTTQQQNMGGLFSSSQQTSGLFAQTTTNPTATSMGLGGNQQSGSVFQLQPKSQTSLFPTGTTNQPSHMPTQSGMIDNTSKGLFSPSVQQTGNMQGSFFGSNQPTTQQPTQQQFPIITLQVTPESADFRNYLTNSMYKQKSITELLNDLQRHYQEQDFFLNDDYSARKPKMTRDINLGESKYSYPSIIPESRQYYDHDYQREKYDIYGSFLKSKRNYNQPKVYGSGGKGLYREAEIRQPEEPKLYKPYNLLDFQYKKDEFKSPPAREESDEIKLKKSHSCDMIKKNETIVVNNLEKSFVSKINIEDQTSNTRSKKISLENTLLDLHVSLQDPIKASFNLKLNKNSKVALLKTAIVDHLKEKYPKLFKKLNVNSFVLMKKYSILKDTILLSEADVKDRETVHVLLKENFNYNYNSNSNVVDNSRLYNEEVQNSRKESKAEQKKKKDELAPMNKLPILEKQGYKTIPDFKDIYRMTLDELENVENFSIYNDWGRIDFEGVTDLTNLNLDQIVTIENKLINVYQNGDVDFKPKVGKGLNKPAILHLYKCFPAESQKGITDEQSSLYLASLQKISKEKGV